MKIIFNIETNGLIYDDDILSFSAIIIDENLEVIEKIERYYYPNLRNKYNLEAISINNLNKKNIKNKRKGVKYPRIFARDTKIKSLFERENITEIIGHNLDFSLDFLNYHLGINFGKIKQFCTMEETQYQYDAPWENYRGEPKYPTLKESLSWANIEEHKEENNKKSSYIFGIYKYLKNQKKH